VTTNDASLLFDGKAQYSCMPNGSGGIVDDLIIYRIREEEYLLVVNASNIEKDWNWIASHNTDGVEMENASDDYALLAIQGPKAAEAMQSLTEVNLTDMGYYTFAKASFAGVSGVIISATGYTGSGGFEIYVPNEMALKVWDAVFAAGEPFGIKPIGLAARDTLRLEMGFCLYGNDIDDTTSPIEAGLGWITKFTKDFIDSERLKSQKEQGVSRKLVAFEMIDRGIPRHDYRILDSNQTPIGKVTSGTMSPSMKVGIGLGYIETSHAILGTEVFIEIREKGVLAKVVKLPFYKK
ncbi:MAG: glycine cleavage system aminomethyltransferase GcvT, partial [Flavobacteriales bacterium]